MNYGFEIELFAANRQKKEIYNATKLINDFLKFNILESGFDVRGTNPILVNVSNFKIISDGTPFEIVGNRMACEKSMLQKCMHYDAANVINGHLNKVREYLNLLFKVDTLLLPFVDNSEWNFVDAGNVYCGGKRKHNAYTNKSFYEDKKEDKKLVTFRSAGFHIHIRFDKEIEDTMFKGVYAPEKCNELIKQLDKVYLKYFPHCLSKINTNLVIQESLRNSKYSTLGDYRMKFHGDENNPFSTLEYRQFSAAFFMLDIDTQRKILHDFADTVRKFTNKIKNKNKKINDE